MISKVLLKLLISFLLLGNMYAGRERSHDQARALICCACGCKDFKCKEVTEALERIVKEEVYSNYDRRDTSFPSGICGACRNNLFKAKRGDVEPTTVRDKWNSMAYDGFRPPSRGSICTCRICQIVRHKGAYLEEKPVQDVPRVIEESDDKENEA